MTTLSGQSMTIKAEDGTCPARFLWFVNGKEALITIDSLHMWTPDELRALGETCFEVADELKPSIGKVDGT